MNGCSRVFVYGTLKKNEPNHHWLLNKNNGAAKFLYEAVTIEKYPLIIGTRYNIPFILYEPGTGNQVAGEVYEIDERMLSNLDILEDHPVFYEREIAKVRNSNEVLDCWIYFLKKFKPELLKLQTFVSYTSKASHNLEYCERYLRDPNYDFKTEIFDYGTNKQSTANIGHSTYNYIRPGEEATLDDLNFTQYGGIITWK